MLEKLCTMLSLTLHIWLELSIEFKQFAAMHIFEKFQVWAMALCYFPLVWEEGNLQIWAVNRNLLAAIRNMCIFASSRAGRAIKLVSSSTPAEGGTKMGPKHLGHIGWATRWAAGRQREKSEWKLSMGTSHGWVGLEREASIASMRNGCLATKCSRQCATIAYLCVLPFNCNAIPVDEMKRVLLYFALLAKFMK